MNVLADPWMCGDGLDQCRREVFGVWRGKPDSLDAGLVRDCADELGKVPCSMMVGIHILAEQGDLFEPTHCGIASFEQDRFRIA